MLVLHFVATLIILLVILVTSSNQNSLHSLVTNLNTPESLTAHIRNFIKNNGSARISRRCLSDVQDYSASLTARQLWAISMFDASSKVPSGILRGNIISLGSFDQCLEVNNITNTRTIRGQYCLGALTLSDNFVGELGDGEKLVLSLGVCIPHSCTVLDLNEFFSEILEVSFRVEQESCQTQDNQPEFDAGAVSAIAFFSAVFGIMLCATTYDTYLHYSQKKPIHPLTTAFSVLTNGRKLFDASSRGQISCLFGIRSITLMWVIIIHEYGIFADTPFVNYKDVQAIKTRFWYMFLHGSSPAVDTFFLMGGLVISYSFLNARRKSNRFNLALFYVHRYLRLTPISAAVVLFNATLMRYVGSGPIFPATVRTDTKNCQNYWWSALLYVQNFVNPSDICNLPSWYLSIDTQLYVVAPVFLFPIAKWPKVAFYVIGLLITVISIGSFLVIWFLKVNALWNANGLLSGNELDDYVKYYFFMPYFRATPWLVGLVLGYVLYENKRNAKKYNLNTFTILFLWIVSVCLMVALIYGPANLMFGKYNRLENAVYAGLVRIAWSFSIAWVIFACENGYGGIINWFLSLSVFQIISKLVYGAYLVHVALIITMTANIQTSGYFSNLLAMHQFWGHFVFSLAAAVILSLAFEYPIPVIEKVLFGRFEEKPAKTDLAVTTNRLNKANV